MREYNKPEIEELKLRLSSCKQGDLCATISDPNTPIPPQNGGPIDDSEGKPEPTSTADIFG